MSKIQAVTVMTLDGFLPEPDDVLTQWVMNHRKGFVHWREHCNAWILPHSILDLLCEKDRKNASFTYLAEVHDAESLELLRELFHYNLVDEPRGVIIFRHNQCLEFSTCCLCVRVF